MIRRPQTLALLTATLLACQGSPSGETGAPTPDATASTQASAQPGADGAQAVTATRPPAAVGSAERKLWQRQPAHASAFAELTVTGDDGQDAPLAIESVEVEVEVRGRMARTQVTQVFRNHLPRQTEGTYAFTLPARAAISRLAMDVEGEMMEGELVERDKARKIYEQIVRGKKDPALLEWQGGDRFKTQIFPIPPKGTKTVVLAYSELLPEREGEAWYRYNLPALEGDAQGSAIQRFRFSLRTDTTQPAAVSGYPAEVDKDGALSVIRVAGEGFVPRGPLEVFFTRPIEETRIQYASHKDQTFFYADLVPSIPAAAKEEDRALVIALDTSAGLGQVELERAKDAITTLIAQLPPERPLRIVHGDFKAHACPALTAGAGAAVEACVSGLEAGGATDLGALVNAATDAALALKSPAHLVLFSDGVASLGVLDADLLEARLEEALGDAPVILHTVATGHSPDEAYLTRLARAQDGHSLRLTPADDAAWFGALLAERIHQPLLTDVAVEVVDGQVEDLVPRQPTSLARGEALGVFGRVQGERATLRITGQHLGQPVSQTLTLEPTPTDHPTLVEFWARGHIAAMERGQVDRDAVVAASLEYGVMSRYTSFLVLENDEAYKRFQIDRKKDRERRAAEAERQQQGPQALTKSKGDLSDLLAQTPDAKPAPAPVEAEMEEKKEEARAPAADEEPMRGVSSGKKMKKKSRRKRPDWSGRIARLEARIGNLTQDEQVRLMGLYARTGKSKDARTFYERLKKAAQGPANLAPHFDNSRVRRLIPEAWREVLEAQLEASPEDPDLLQLHAELLIELADFETLERLYGKRALPREARQAILERLLLSAQAALGQRLLDGWIATFQLSPEDIEALLQPHALGPYAATLFTALSALEQGDADFDVARMDRFVEAGFGAKQQPAVLDALVARCGTGTLPVERCRTWLGRFPGDARAAEALERAAQARLKHIPEARARDIANPELILELAALLEDVGRQEEAERALSELVEFAPRDFATRGRYAEALVSRDQVAEACGQYAAAVQLNPAERDTFRTMMSLRRAHPQYARQIRSCILDGVSNLPVQRDISLLLTWEDSSADVDLHIHEAPGEEVYYSHRESEAGGLLYYDITDGYGPEIYVLGSAPKGDYRLELVYFSGSADALEGTLTVLRNAGAPNETREDHPFTLKRARGKTPLPVTTLTF